MGKRDEYLSIHVLILDGEKKLLIDDTIKLALSSDCALHDLSYKQNE